MATASKYGPQDMPPDGGYKPLQWERVKPKIIFGSRLTIGLTTASIVIGGIGYIFSVKKKRRDDTEMRSARHAILPMLIAERDRAFLKQIRKNRDEEKELMKNVPEWEVGTYFGEPVYITMADKFMEPSYNEFVVHAGYWDSCYRRIRRLFY